MNFSLQKVCDRIISRKNFYNAMCVCERERDREGKEGGGKKGVMEREKERSRDLEIQRPSAKSPK